MIASILQILGLLTVAAGGYLLAPWLGVVILGAALLVVGLALEGVNPDAPSRTVKSRIRP